MEIYTANASHVEPRAPEMSKTHPSVQTVDAVPNATQPDLMLPPPAGQRRRIHRSGNSRTRREHIDSETAKYFCDSTQAEQPPPPWSHQNQDEVRKMTLKQSRRIPGWAWYILAKLLGIKLHAFDRPIVGTIFYMVMLLVVGLYVVTSIWHDVFDIESKYTKSTLLTGLVEIIGTLFWCSMGIYAYKLAGKLFRSPKFVDSVRMHTKTVFKISAAGVLFLLATAVTVINNYNASDEFRDEKCEVVNVSPWICRICYVTRVVFSALALFFHLLVGIVLLSVCRTHTIGIRRLIKELEEDGRSCDLIKKMGGHPDNMSQATEDERYLWDEDDLQPFQGDVGAGCHDPQTNQTASNIAPHSSAPHQNANSNPQQRHNSIPTEQGQTPDKSPISEHAPSIEGASSLPPHLKPTERPSIIIVGADSPRRNRASLEVDQSSQSSLQNFAHYDLPISRGLRSPVDSSHLSTRAELSSPRKVPSSLSGLSDGSGSVSSFTLDQLVLTNEDLLFRHWKISNRLLTTSLCLQRWLLGMISFILLWSLNYILHWLNKEARVMELLEFALPIMILPLVCSAFGEVNYESTRVIKVICPVEERLQVVKYMREQPMEMTVFGFPINYSTIVTALGAIGLAFSTRLIMDEIQP